MQTCRWNIAPHDIKTKLSQLQKFLDKDLQVAVCVTFETRKNKWTEQYPKAVEV
jgi:translation initiation factor IF-3